MNDTPVLRPLGRSALRVSPLAFGGNVFGWTADETTSFALLDAFVEAGFNFIDTADAYSRFVPGNVGGESETILGRWFAARGPAMRARVVLATKVGLEMGPGDIGLSAQYIRRAVDRSLQRLQTDYIDLYQAHRDDPSVPLEETAVAFDALVKAGKVRVLGASNFSADRLAAALEVSAKLGLARYESLQPHYNLVVRSEFDSMLVDNARIHGATVLEGHSARDVHMENGKATGARLIPKNGSEFDIAADVVIDATGQTALIANKLGLKKPDPLLRKSSVWTYYEGAAREPGRLDEGATLVLATQGKKGWFWYIP
ncbi:MAG: FAD-binding protein, partial [Gammaproteobacteria bacterium]|nr:FAD-binding protein [Gammaproteobacteria bacterium]